MADDLGFAQKKLTVGSLFAGIGGFDLGLERAGMEIKWQVEIDANCHRVLSAHWPSTKRYGDIRDLHAPEPAWVDLICGGFPCQDISVLGRRAGLQGQHSGLWREFARVVGEVRPRYILVENTPSLLVRGMGEILGDFSRMGYDAEWAVVPAAAAGANHLRARLWILAHAAGVGVGDSEPAILSGWDDALVRDWWRREPGICRVDDGTPYRVDRLRLIGNAIVPQIAEWIGRRILEAEAQIGSPPRGEGMRQIVPDDKEPER